MLYPVLITIETTLQNKMKTTVLTPKQIEQKILPKLRGLDLEVEQHHFSELIDIVDRLGDQSLQAELQKRVQVGSGAFLWRGLDRSDEAV